MPEHAARLPGRCHRSGRRRTGAISSCTPLPGWAWPRCWRAGWAGESAAGCCGLCVPSPWPPGTASQENLDQRLALTAPPDELKELADTFDGMLARLDSASSALARLLRRRRSSLLGRRMTSSWPPPPTSFASAAAIDSMPGAGKRKQSLGANLGATRADTFASPAEGDEHPAALRSTSWTGLNESGLPLGYLRISPWYRWRGAELTPCAQPAEDLGSATLRRVISHPRPSTIFWSPAFLLG